MENLGENIVDGQQINVPLPATISLLSFLQVPEIFNAFSPYMDQLELQSRYESAIVNALREVGSNEISEPIMRYIMGGKLSASEIDAVMNEWKKLDPSRVSRADINIVLPKLEKFVKDRMIQSIISHAIYNQGIISNKDIDKCQEIANISFENSGIVDFTDKDLIRNLKEVEGQNTTITSSIPSINDAFIYHGYRTTQVVIVCAAPGVGKSMFMIDEAVAALKQGKKVLHFFLGDLTLYDVLCRYLCCILEKPSLAVLTNIEEESSNPEAVRCFENLKIGCYASGDLTSAKILHMCQSLHKSFPFDMVVIDYDSNVRPTTDNMYQEGGNAYSDYDKIAKNLNCLVMVGAQPKVIFWDQEVLGKDAVGESARKQHTTDVLITIGRNKENGNVGTLAIAKSRRGGEGTKINVRFDYHLSKITQISDIEYIDITKTQAMQALPSAQSIAMSKKKS